LIEDSRTQVAIVREHLRMGFDAPVHMEHDESLAGGLARLAQASFDLLLLDLNVTDSAGFDTFLTAKAAAPDLPIVVLTGEEGAAQAVQEGAHDYIVKGECTPESLARCIRHAVEHLQ